LSVIVPQQAIDLISSFEGFSSTIYYCAGGKPTIGYGHVLCKGEECLEPMSQEVAEDHLKKDAAWAAYAVDKLVHKPLTQNQRAALISLVFNIGSGNFQASTIRSRLNQGDYAGAANSFWMWRRANGKILPGLVRRREAEKNMFIEPLFNKT